MSAVYTLSPAEQEAFFEVGYVVIEDLFRPDEVAQMAAAFDRMEQVARQLKEPQEIEGTVFVVEAKETLRIHRIQWVGSIEPILRQVGEDQRLLQLASQVLGSRSMNHLINQAHYKLPGDQVAFPWHQDSQFRRYGTELWEDKNQRGSFVQIAIAIDPMTDDNGPLQFIPGSCKLGHLGLDKMLQAADEEVPRDGYTVKYELPEGLQEKVRAEDAVSMTLSQGSAVMFGPYTIHRSLPNRSNRPRRVLINGYAYPGANARTYPGNGAGRLLTIPA